MVSKFLTPIAHLFGGRAPEPELTEAERAALAEDERKRKEALKYLRGNDETRNFQRVVADFALREAGMAAAVSEAGPHAAFRAMLGGEGAKGCLDRAMRALKNGKATLGERPVDRLQIGTLLASPALDGVVRRRLLPLTGAVADFTMRELGVASPHAAEEVRPTVLRILAGSHSITFVDKATAAARESGATVLEAEPSPEHVAACLASPLLAEHVRAKLKPILDAELVDDEPADRRQTPPAE